MSSTNARRYVVDDEYVEQKESDQRAYGHPHLFKPDPRGLFELMDGLV